MIAVVLPFHSFNRQSVWKLKLMFSRQQFLCSLLQSILYSVRYIRVAVHVEGRAKPQFLFSPATGENEMVFQILKKSSLWLLISCTRVVPFLLLLIGIIIHILRALHNFTIA